MLATGKCSQPVAHYILYCADMSRIYTCSTTLYSLQSVVVTFNHGCDQSFQNSKWHVVYILNIYR
jgi:hypothetical protein